MIKEMPTRGRLLNIGAAVAALLMGAVAGGWVQPAAAEDAADFYNGKTVRFTTSNSPGGGFDFYMRAAAKHFSDVTGVHTSAQNITGAGGVIGDNQLYSAAPDGLTLGLINFPGHVFNQILGKDGVEYDFTKWQWLGRVAGVAPALVVAEESPFQNLEDLINSDQPVRFGLEGRGSDAFYATVFLKNTLGIPVQQIVGYGGPGEISAAMLAGEIDARLESIDTLLPDVERGSARVIVLFDRERDPRLPDAPALPDVGLDANLESTLIAFSNIYKLERSFVAPPETPADRVAFLRDGLLATFESEAFQSEVTAAGRSVAPLSGEELAAEVNAIVEQFEELKQLFIETN